MTSTAGTIIFDLDGTLVDSVPDLANALDRLMVEEGLPEIGRQRARTLIGHGIRAFIKAAFSFHSIAVEGEREGQLVQRFKAIYAVALADETTVYPGVLDTLDRLRADGHRLGVCTNKDERFARTILERLGLDSHFVTVAGPDTFGFTKPDPRHLTDTIRAIDPARPAIFVGDSEVDAQTAIAANVPVVIMSHGYCKQPLVTLGADRLADSFAELPDMIRDLLNSSQNTA